MLNVCIQVKMDYKYAFRMVLNSKHFKCLVHPIYFQIKTAELK